MAQSKGWAQRYSWMVLYTQTGILLYHKKSQPQDQQLSSQEFLLPLEQLITNNHANHNQWAKDVKPHFPLYLQNRNSAKCG